MRWGLGSDQLPMTRRKSLVHVSIGIVTTKVGSSK